MRNDFNSWEEPGNADEWVIGAPPACSKGTLLVSATAWYMPVDFLKLSDQWKPGTGSRADQNGNGSGASSGDLFSIPTATAPASLSPPTSKTLKRYLSMKWDCCTKKEQGGGVYWFNYKWVD